MSRGSEGVNELTPVVPLVTVISGLTLGTVRLVGFGLELHDDRI